MAAGSSRPQRGAVTPTAAGHPAADRPALVRRQAISRCCIPLAPAISWLHYQPAEPTDESPADPRTEALVRDVLPLAELDVLVTPLVAIDVSGQRLGNGRRFTTGCCKNSSSIACAAGGYVHDCQQVIACRAKSGIPLPAVYPGKNLVLVGTRGREIFSLE